MAASAAFALALLAKEAVAFIPLALVVDALCLQPAERRRPALRGALALFAMLVAVLALRSVVLRGSSLAVGPPLVAATRVLTSLGHLLVRTVAPWPLTVWSSRIAHGASGAVSYPLRDLAVGLLFVASLCAAAVVALRRPSARAHAADLAWFALALLPVANPVELNLSQLVADRYLYLPHVLLAAALARALLPALRSTGRLPAVGAFVAAGAALGALAFVHARHFHDELGLWRHEVAVDRANPMARLSLARAVASRRRYGEALGEVRQALLDAQSQSARAVQMDGVLLSAALLLDGLPDADQRGLASVRGFLDGLGNHPGRPALLDAGGLRMQLTLQAPDAARVRSMDVEWALSLADSAVRTLDADAAIAAFRALQPRLPNHPRVYAGTAAAWVLLDRVDEAARALDRAPAFVAPALARTRAVLRSRACVDPGIDPRRVRVRCALALDLREHARRLAARGPGEPLDAEFIVVTLTADVRDGLCRRATRRLAEARAAAPGFDATEAAAVVGRCGTFVPREE